MVKPMAFEKRFVAEKADKEKLKEIFQQTESEEISAAIVNAKEELGLNIWSSVLSLLDNEEKLFEIVKDVLPKLNRDQLSMKSLNSFYSRLCMELTRFSLEFCVKLAYFCESSIQFGDPRACFFKDILPCILQILAKDDRTVTFDGETKTAVQSREEIISGVLKKPFKVSVLTSITSMFKDIPLKKPQTEQLLGKICDNFSNVNHADVSGLSLACFILALFNRLEIPVLALDTYFYNQRYKKKFVELGSESVDSIDETADKGIIETEENVIFHFQHVTEFTSIEKDIESALRPLAFAPKFIISPFIATILVSFAKMSSSSVSGNLRLPQSILLPFMLKVFMNNEKHRAILHNSAWARSVDQFEPINIEKLLIILQENTCKLGQNVALNGLIGLTFMLLKTKDAPALNAFAIHFLNELCKQRPEFTSDIMKIVVKMLFSERNKGPIIECFSIMIQNRSLAIDRCVEALADLIENLTELELDTALAIESVIHSSITKSSKLRDLMSSTMRTAMYQNKPEMRKLAVFSFCVMLKKVTKPSHGSNFHEAFGHSQSISMMSFISQSQLPSKEKVNMRRVSVLVLEILGILRKCFSHGVDIRVTLYESLLSAVAANPFIIPNVLELVESHFRDYFDSEDPDQVINFEKVFKRLENGETAVMDHLGKFLSFFVQCIEIAEERIEIDETPQMGNYNRVIENLIEKIGDVTMEQMDIFSILDEKASSTITQFLNCIEVLMAHCSKDISTSESIDKILNLFGKHQRVTAEAVKLQDNHKKGSKRGKNQTEIGQPKVEISFECVWDFKTCGNFMAILTEDHANEKINEIKQNKHLFRFVVKSLSHKILQLTSAPDYLKIKNSRTTFSSLRKFSAILFQQLEQEAFDTLFMQFDAESAVSVTEAFKNAVNAMDKIYNSPSKWQEFLQKVTGSANTVDKMITMVIERIQMTIDWAFESETAAILSDSNGEKIVLNLFTTMELMFKNFQTPSNAYAKEGYNWLLQFCKNTTVEQRNLHIINKVFFQVMIQQDAGNTMMEHIVYKISSVYGLLDEDLLEPADSTQNDFKSISIVTVDMSLNYFANILKKQIEDIEFCILRMNSYNAHVKIPGQDSRNESINALQSLEKSCVMKLTHLGKVVTRLCNSQFSTRNNQVETIGNLVKNYFICIGNLMKHFCQHFSVKNIDFQIIPLDILMRETKSTVKYVNNLAPYVEDKISEEAKKMLKDKKNKKTPVATKELKYMSRLVLEIEKFRTVVAKLDALTKRNFSKHILVGDVRDFRIDKSERSREFQERNASENATNSPEREDVPLSSSSGSEVEDKDEDEDEEEVTPARKRSHRNRIQSSSSSEGGKTIDSDATDASLDTSRDISPEAQVVTKAKPRALKRK